MESYKSHKLLFITSVLSVLILTIGGTLSFFTVSNRSKYDAVAIQAERIQLALKIEPLYTERVLIPTNDKDIMTAYNNQCVDIYGRGACIAYNIIVSNFNKEQDLIGKIDFEVDGINNLSYIVLDQNKFEYLSKQSIANGTTKGMSLGEHFVLSNGTELNPSVKVFTLIIWLTNLDRDQTAEDEGGIFTASVSYESVDFGSKLTGTINKTVNVNDKDDSSAEVE